MVSQPGGGLNGMVVPRVAPSLLPPPNTECTTKGECFQSDKHLFPLLVHANIKNNSKYYDNDDGVNYNIIMVIDDDDNNNENNNNDNNDNDYSDDDDIRCKLTEAIRVRVKQLNELWRTMAMMFVACLTSHQHSSIFQEQIWSDNFTCCHTEIEAADQTRHLTQSQYTDTRSTGPRADSLSQAPVRIAWSTNF